MLEGVFHLHRKRFVNKVRHWWTGHLKRMTGRTLTSTLCKSDLGFQDWTISVACGILNWLKELCYLKWLVVSKIFNFLYPSHWHHVNQLWYDSLVGGFKHMGYFPFHIYIYISIYGMSSFPLTKSIIFQDGWLLHHQPVALINHHYITI